MITEQMKELAGIPVSEAKRETSYKKIKFPKELSSLMFEGKKSAYLRSSVGLDGKTRDTILVVADELGLYGDTAVRDMQTLSGLGLMGLYCSSDGSFGISDKGKVVIIFKDPATFGL